MHIKELKFIHTLLGKSTSAITSTKSNNNPFTLSVSKFLCKTVQRFKRSSSVN